MTDAEIEQLTNEAQRVAAETNNTTPSLNTWGIESYGDASPAIGGGVGGFLWFNTRDELLDFTGRLLPFFAPGPSIADHGAVASKAAAIVIDVRSGAISADEGMARLNKVLRNFSQIRWWGQLQELIVGDRPFEKEIRSWWRTSMSEDDEESEDTSPIHADEIDSFVESLTEWGF